MLSGNVVLAGEPGLEIDPCYLCLQRLWFVVSFGLTSRSHSRDPPRF